MDARVDSCLITDIDMIMLALNPNMCLECPFSPDCLPGYAGYHDSHHHAGVDVSLVTLLALGVMRLYTLNRNAVAALGSAAAGATRSVVNSFSRSG